MWWSTQSLYMTKSRMQSAAFNAYSNVFLEIDRMEEALRKEYVMATPEEKDKLWQKHQVILQLKGFITKKLEE
jgi:hypothetical protein